MHTIDLMTSDADLAGLVIRCGPRAPEILISVITPFRPNAHPKIAIGAANSPVDLVADVISPGTLLLLPPAASALLSDRWQALPQLEVEISGEGRTLRGTVPIEGLAAALPTLSANCPAR
jgi:hypothetical protein